jgi:hypothetical protein
MTQQLITLNDPFAFNRALNISSHPSTIDNLEILFNCVPMRTTVLCSFIYFYFNNPIEVHFYVQSSSRIFIRPYCSNVQSVLHVFSIENHWNQLSIDCSRFNIVTRQLFFVQWTTERRVYQPFQAPSYCAWPLRYVYTCVYVCLSTGQFSRRSILNDNRQTGRQTDRHTGWFNFQFTTTVLRFAIFFL